ncbi:hypothetical protein ABFX02_03G016300 [Erythranthe guttata]
MKMISPSLIFCLILLTFTMQGRVEACTNILCAVDMVLEECTAGRCLVYCASKYRGATRYGECYSANTCHCVFDCCI